MNNIIRFWNQSRRGIIIGVIAIVLVIVLIQVLNDMAREQNNKRQENVQTTQEKELPTESKITGEKVSVDTTKSNISIIEDFITKCNNQDITGAYNLLTKECKEVLFPTEEEFINKYYNIIFQKKRSYGIENYMNSFNTYVYEVKFYEDVLSTGKVNTTQVYQDYISINTKAEGGKVNINSFIEKKEINKSKQKGGITITVISKEIYKEYEKYKVKIENRANKAIMINTNRKLQTVNLQDTNGTKYEAYITEIAENLLILNSNMAREYEIKFNKIYNPSISIATMNFEDIVDYELYLNLEEDVQETAISVEI